MPHLVLFPNGRVLRAGLQPSGLTEAGPWTCPHSLSWRGRGSRAQRGPPAARLGTRGARRPPSDVPEVTLRARHTSKGHGGWLSCPRSHSGERAGPVTAAGSGRGVPAAPALPRAAGRRPLLRLRPRCGSLGSDLGTSQDPAVSSGLTGEAASDEGAGRARRGSCPGGGQVGDPDGWGRRGAGGGSASRFGFCREGRPSTSYRWGRPVTAQNGPCRGRRRDTWLPGEPAGGWGGGALGCTGISQGTSRPGGGQDPGEPGESFLTRGARVD